MEKVFAGFNVEVKQTEDSRTLEFIGSTETIDRQQEMIVADGWDLKNYKKNPVVLFAHDYSQPPVGKANKVWIEDGTLKFKVEFAPVEANPLADMLFRLYKGGFMKATSVGFRPMEWKYGEGPKDPYRTFTKQELLELSLVPVPANPQALMSEKSLLEAWKQNVISEKEWDEFAARVKALAKKEVTFSDIEELQKKLSDLQNEFSAFKGASDEQIKKLSEKIDSLKEKDYFDLLLSGSPDSVSLQGKSEGRKLVEKLVQHKGNGHA